jgi:hypothetical protein
MKKKGANEEKNFLNISIEKRGERRESLYWGSYSNLNKHKKKT